MSKQKSKAEIAGGKGGNFANPSRSDCQLIQRAVKNGWNIKPQVFEDLPDLMEEVVRNKSKPALQVSAAKVILAMNAQNNQQPKQTNILNVHGDFYD